LQTRWPVLREAMRLDSLAETVQTACIEGGSDSSTGGAVWVSMAEFLRRVGKKLEVVLVAPKRLRHDDPCQFFFKAEEFRTGWYGTYDPVEVLLLRRPVESTLARPPSTSNFGSVPRAIGFPRPTRIAFQSRRGIRFYGTGMQFHGTGGPARFKHRSAEWVADSVLILVAPRPCNDPVNERDIRWVGPRTRIGVRH